VTAAARSAGGWLELLRSLGESLVAMMRAEAAGLGKDLGESGRRLAIALGLLLVAGALLFWAVAVLTLTGIELLALWLPRWAASLIVLVLLLLAIIGLGLGARSQIRRVESPAATVRRRLEDHLAWWQERVAGGGREVPAASAIIGGEPPPHTAPGGEDRSADRPEDRG
jgi:uncharacterized membrane protein YqjE